MRNLCVIPARLGATRLPNKPLRLLGDEPLIKLVVQRVMDLAPELPIVVATDAEAVRNAVRDLPVRAILTAAAHRSGTERVAEVAARAEYRDVDVVLNVQGDEPWIAEAALRGALERVLLGAEIGTAAAPLAATDLWNPCCVKVAVDGRGRARRFFRTPGKRGCASRDAVFHHVGVYAYRREALARWIRLPVVADELVQSLEQLRPLAHGLEIGVAVQSDPAAPGIDTEVDLALAARGTVLIRGTAG